ncbi:MAG: S1 RNA-binding domain-containing protein, partial [Deltaproteobacteria bacterium]
GKMAEALSEARGNFSKYAPRIFTMKVKQDKVREVIGSGGKVIRGIIEKTGVKIDIEDDGTIHIASVDEGSAQKAIDIINQIVEEPEAGKIYEGKITRIADFGAFVEIIPGTEGLCHISELEHYRVRQVEDVVKLGDTIQVKCLEVDPSGKIRLSRKVLLSKDASQPSGPKPEPREGREDAGNDENRGNRIESRSERGDRGRDREPRGDREHYRGGDRGDRDRGPRRDRGDRDRGGRDFRDRGPDRGPDRDRPRPDRDRDRGGRFEGRRPERDDRGFAGREDRPGRDRESRNQRREPDDRGFSHDISDDFDPRYDRDDDD